LQRDYLTGGYVAGGLQTRGRIDDALFWPFLAGVLRFDGHEHCGGRVVVAPRHGCLTVQRWRWVQGAGLAGRQYERSLEPQQPPIAVGDGDVPLAVRVAQLERYLLVAVSDARVVRDQAPQRLVIVVHCDVHSVALLNEHGNHL